MKRLALIVATLLCLLVSASAYAWNPLTNACNSGGDAKEESAACSADASKDPIAGPNGVLHRVGLLFGILGGIVAVLVIIISGFRFILADGDAQKTASARNSILGAVVGLVIIAASTTIILFVVSRFT